MLSPFTVSVCITARRAHVNAACCADATCRACYVSLRAFNIMPRNDDAYIAASRMTAATNNAAIALPHISVNSHPYLVLVSSITHSSPPTCDASTHSLHGC